MHPQIVRVNQKRSRKAKPALGIITSNFLLKIRFLAFFPSVHFLDNFLHLLQTIYVHKEGGGILQVCVIRAPGRLSVHKATACVVIGGSSHHRWPLNNEFRQSQCPEIDHSEKN